MSRYYPYSADGEPPVIDLEVVDISDSDDDVITVDHGDDYVVEFQQVPCSPLNHHVDAAVEWGTLYDMYILGCPFIILRLVSLVWGTVANLEKLHLVELFSGGRAGEAITLGFRKVGLRAKGVEIERHGLLEDIMSVQGWLYCLGLICRLYTGAVLWAAPVCTTWVWLCRSVTKRSRLRPLGAEWIPQVAEANNMVSRPCRAM